MKILTVNTAPIEGQKPGTSGLRKKTRVFMEANFLENYVQSIFDAIGGIDGATLVIGGDGRFFNARAIQTILKMMAANGAARAIVGQDGLLSTPAASHLIRKRKTRGGLILSASHNPGGLEADFGLKFNMENGGPASDTISDAIYAKTQTISSYSICDCDNPDISLEGERTLGAMTIEVIDPVADYAELMENLFDFTAIRGLFAEGFTMRFDAMHAATGPYAKTILEDRLGAPKGTVINGTPLSDFGGGHPDPNPTWARPLVDLMMSDDAPDFGAASDGDGDRNMILGRGIYVTPSDSLALLAAQAHHAPVYAGGLLGVARSMPTSMAVDRVAEAKGVACHETPTGWKFFGNLLDAGQVTLCGEESAGTGSGHIREKDGLWAVLLWLNILAATSKPVSQLMSEHWEIYGRNYYSRHDYEAIDAESAARVISTLRARLQSMPGTTVAGLKIAQADEFSYDDPVDGSHSASQGVRVIFEDGARAVFRLSGTGTDGATIRVYLERLETNSDQLHLDVSEFLQPVAVAADILSDLSAITRRTSPDVVS